MGRRVSYIRQLAARWLCVRVGLHARTLIQRSNNRAAAAAFNEVDADGLAAGCRRARVQRRAEAAVAAFSYLLALARAALPAERRVQLTLCSLDGLARLLLETQRLAFYCRLFGLAKALACGERLAGEERGLTLGH